MFYLQRCQPGAEQNCIIWWYSLSLFGYATINLDDPMIYKWRTGLSFLNILANVCGRANGRVWDEATRCFCVCVDLSAYCFAHRRFSAQQSCKVHVVFPAQVKH